MTCSIGVDIIIGTMKKSDRPHGHTSRKYAMQVSPPPALPKMPCDILPNFSYCPR